MKNLKFLLMAIGILSLATSCTPTADDENALQLVDKEKIERPGQQGN